MSTNHILIIALSNHPVLGPLLIPYFAKTVSQDVISVEEQATHAGNDTELSEMEKRVIAIAQSYSEKNLMQVYSRQQTVAGFLSSVTAEMLKKGDGPVDAGESFAGIYERTRCETAL